MVRDLTTDSLWELPFVHPSTVNDSIVNLRSSRLPVGGSNRGGGYALPSESVSLRACLARVANSTTRSFGCFSSPAAWQTYPGRHGITDFLSFPPGVTCTIFGVMMRVPWHVARSLTGTPPCPSTDAANTFDALTLSRLPRAPDQAYREKGSQALRIVAGGSVGMGGGDDARVVRQVVGYVVKNTAWVDNSRSVSRRE